MNNVVKLTWEDFMVAIVKGGCRQLQVIKNGRVGHDHGKSSDRQIRTRIGDSVIGELGELAVSRLLRLPVTSALGDSKAADVGRFEVKTTEWVSGGLPVYDRASDDQVYILVVLVFNRNTIDATVCGWMRAGDAKRDEWFKESFKPPCYLVPQGKLNSMETLEVNGCS